MPSNLVSRTSCSIYPINHPTLPAGLPSQEYKHHAFKSSATGAIQEIVTIESCEDTSFEVKVDIHPCAYSLLHDQQPNHSTSLKEDDYLVYVQLDGINAQRSKRHRSQNGPTRISGVYSTDLKSSRSFQFGKLQLVDPDDNNRICKDDKIIQALGTIQVNIVRCTLGPPKATPHARVKSNPSNKRRPSPPRRHPRRSDPESLQTTNQMIFSERSKKACQVNTVGLGKPIAAPIDSIHNKKTIRPVLKEDANPFLQFIFKYKPRSILEAEGIIAPPPPPPQLPPQDSRPLVGNKTRQSTVKNEASNDYPSGSDHHQGSHDQQEDEKKPKCKTEPVCISIDSDSETDCSETETKRKVIQATTNGHSRASGSNGTTKNRTFKFENGAHDENQPPHADHSDSNQQPKSDSKKRIRTATAINEQPNKRRSSMTTNSNIHQNGGGLSRSANNKINPPADQVSALKFRQSTNNIYLDDSSDDDEKFEDQILGSVRAKSCKDDLKDSKKLSHSNEKVECKEEEQSNKKKLKATIVTVNNNNNSSSSSSSNAIATTSNLHHRKIVKEEPEKKVNPADFFDLTELDSD